MDRRGHRATFGIDGNVLYLDCGPKFMGICIFPNAQGYTIYVDTVTYKNYTSIKLFFFNSSLQLHGISRCYEGQGTPYCLSEYLIPFHCCDFIWLQKNDDLQGPPPICTRPNYSRAYLRGVAIRSLVQNALISLAILFRALRSLQLLLKY